MFVRALLAFLALPGMVAGVIPVFIALAARNDHAGSATGFGLVGLGLFLLLWCVRDFYVSGKGTLAPWHPPKHLVAVGLYRRVRNPMYIAVLTIVLGWSVVFGSAWLALYLLALAVGFHLRVVLHEEPWLRRQFTEEWGAYSASVSRWLPRLTPGKDQKRD
jgi:protein-S-isoprenylcysteine O-methyltransferase Ste14